MQLSPSQRRSSLWTYYDRRVAYREPSAHSVLNYFLGLGVKANLDAINSELFEVGRRLRQLPPTTFLDVGAGPSGTFTSHLPGWGCALDQSEAALRQFRLGFPAISVLRSDALHLPIVDNAVRRVFMSHLYGLLLPDERLAVLAEGYRVSEEIVILDSGRPPGAQSEEWQTRTLPDGSRYLIYRRHLAIDVLLTEVGGQALYAGQYFVMVRAEQTTGLSTAARGATG